MASIRHLSNAPITEAIIDIRAALDPGFAAARFKELKATLVDFPQIEERRSIGARIEFAAGKVSASNADDLGVQGIFFKKEDGLTIAQFRVDGFTLNRLKPYTSWTDLFPEAMVLWEHYIRIARPITVSRIALRYINHFFLNAPVGEFGQYLTASPSIPTELPQAVSSFFSRIVIHDPALEVAAGITQGLDDGLKEEEATLILDIDAFIESSIDPSSSDIKSKFQVLHNFKNRVFFSSITETLAKRYE